MRKLGRAAVLVSAVAALMTTAAPAFAGTVTQPRTNPIVVPASETGAPYSFTVQASGFQPGENVFIEQCDGSSTSSIFWDPTQNCDLGSSPAATPADANGNVTFGSTDGNHAFHPFKGSSPQGLFDCLSANDAPSVSGNPSFTNCQVRVSTNNASVTSDQVFFALTLPNATTKVSCATTGSLSFVKPLTNVAPKKPKATKIKGSSNFGSAVGTACTNTAPTGTKYPASSGSVKFKGSLPAGSNCSALSNPNVAGTIVTVKWQGISPKTHKLSTAGKSTAVLNSATVAALPTGGYVLSGPITIGSFAGSTLRVQLALNGGISNETTACNAGSLGSVAFTGVMSPSSLAVL